MAPWIDQLVREHRPLPFVAQFVAATGDLSWAPAIALGITLPALLLPDGRLRSRRWRVVVVTSVTGAALTILASPLVPGPLEEMGIENPFGLAGPAGKVAGTLAHAGILLHWLSLPPAAVCVVLRFRSSRGVERQQLRRAAAGAAGAVAAFSPLRHRVQGLVDRRFNRRRYDAARTVEGFAAHLRDQVDLDALQGELLAVVDQTMQPTRTSLWLRGTS